MTDTVPYLVRISIIFSFDTMLSLLYDRKIHFARRPRIRVSNAVSAAAPLRQKAEMVRDDAGSREEIRDGLVLKCRETGFLFHIVR